MSELNNLVSLPRRYRHNLAQKFVLDNETKFDVIVIHYGDNLGTSINQVLSFCHGNFVILCQEQNSSQGYFLSSNLE